MGPVCNNEYVMYMDVTCSEIFKGMEGMMVMMYDVDYYSTLPLLECAFQ